MEQKTSQPARAWKNWQTSYSAAFLLIVFAVLLSQIFVSRTTLHSLSTDYLWKRSLLDAYRNFKYYVGDKVFPYAVVGKDGWLFYTGEMSLRNYQKVDPLNVSNIKKLVNIFRQLEDEAAGYGGKFIVVVAPDKSTVYPQHMPDEIPVIGTVTSVDRLIERVDAYSDINIIDLRPVLIEASKTSLVYYKTDSHWNCLGAYYAYAEIISRLSTDFPDLKPRPLGDFEFVSAGAGRFDIARMMDASGEEEAMTVTPLYQIDIVPVSGRFPALTGKSLRVVENPDHAAPSLIMVHDSFYDMCLRDFIEPEFSRTVSIAYPDVEIPDLVRMIEAEKPDIVIVQLVERFMDYFLWHFYE